MINKLVLMKISEFCLQRKKIFRLTNCKYKYSQTCSYSISFIPNSCHTF